VQYDRLFGGDVGANKVEASELHVIGGDGEEIPVEIGTSRLEFEGEETVYGVFRDITDRREAEEREEFLHSLLRHDVKNKAHIVQGYLEIMEDYDMQEEVREFLMKAENGLREGMEIIEKVRTLREAQDESVEAVGIKEVMREVLEEAREMAGEEGVEIEGDTPDEDLEVRGGPLLSQVFTNIVGNAIQHSEGDVVRVRWDASEGDVTCSVEDDGVGIPEGDRDKIFDRGYTTDDERGTGLGMFLVETLLEIYGGGIEVGDSELGGAKFDVHLKRV
jgi:signal transduction histidine kinase